MVSNQLYNQGPKNFKIGKRDIEILKRNKSFKLNQVIGLKNRVSLSFTCLWSDCAKEFSRHLNMMNHLRMHTGERPFACYYCDFKFSQSCNLNKHLLIAHKIRPFLCNKGKFSSQFLYKNKDG
jgi:uncharacterized Zn-finger protein